MPKPETSNSNDGPSFQAPRYRPNWPAALVCFILGTLITVALVAYHPSQSRFITSNPVDKNPVGSIGAETVHALLLGVGWSAWLLPFFLFWLLIVSVRSSKHLTGARIIAMIVSLTSSASLATLMTALYFHCLRPEDRVAVKPHASPIFHAINYLFGKQTRRKLEEFRGFGGAQSYPSRTKDGDLVDFSTGSVGLGVAQTLFASLVQDYVRAKKWQKQPVEGRMIALVGDAEMDEGNIFEALLEGWKHGVRNTWWVVDYNRQSLDAVVREGLWERFESIFRNFGWDVWSCNSSKYSVYCCSSFFQRRISLWDLISQSYKNIFPTSRFNVACKGCRSVKSSCFCSD